jgi:molybdenum cofactor cytidylyltransferase
LNNPERAFTESDIAGVVLAAGLSSRMGKPKMVLPWGNRTVIGNVVWTLQIAGVKIITIVTGGSADLIETALESYLVSTVFNPNYSNGDMLFSIQAGLVSLPGYVQAALVVLGDQPQIEERTVRDMIDLFHQEKPLLIVPSFNMHRGHPWLIERYLWADIQTIKPPETMRNFFHRHSDLIRYLEVDSPSILSDLDTPENYEKNKPAPQG